MDNESSALRKQDHRVIDIDTQRTLNRQQQHYAVIDIGSNSIRLVVYDDLSRSPFPRFNEKSLIALGSSLDSNGNFIADAIDRVRHVLVRFSAIAMAMDVSRIDVLATEATRKAANREELVRAIQEEVGLDTRILTGEEEAHYTALGVISGFYQPKGIVGDIGGGSLEIAEIDGDQVGERRTSVPLGALPVKVLLEEGLNSAKKNIDSVLDSQLPELAENSAFFAVGGGWRALARVYIAMNDIPVKVVHGFDAPANEFVDLAKSIARMTTEQVAALPDVPSRRIETLSASALVMWRVLRKLRPNRLVFSAFGLREGWLYSQLDEQEKYRDPLLEGALALGLPMARVSGFSEALSRWTENLFPDETQRDRRLRLSVCALTDIAWRDHQKIRGWQSFERILQFPFIGITHRERAYLATAIMARYAGKANDRAKSIVDGLLTAPEKKKAEILGRTLLLGHRFSASVPEILTHSRLRIEPDAVRLDILDAQSVPDSAAVQSRLQQLAKTAGIRKAEITRSDN